MQSYDLDAAIREHAERIDAAVPHVTFDDLAVSLTDSDVGASARRVARVPGYVIAVAAALATLLGVGGGLLALDLIGPNRGAGSEQIRSETTLPSTVAPEVSTTAPAVETTIDPGSGPAGPALPLEWTRYETEAALEIVGAGGNVIIVGGQEFFVDEHGYKSARQRIWRSTDPPKLTETIGPALTTDLGLRDMAYGDGRYVALSRDAIIHSEDGVTWMNSQHVDDVWVGGAPTWSDEPGTTNGYLTAIAYGNGRYVAVGGVVEFPAIDVSADNLSERPAVWTSADANTWSRSTDTLPGIVSTGAGEVMVSDVVFDGEGFVAVGLVAYDRPAFWRSADGLSWSLDSPDSGGAAASVAASSDGYVAVGSDGYWFSEDSSSWTWFDHYVGDDVTYGDGTFVAVGWASIWDDAHTSIVAADAVIQYSIDGVTWSPVVADLETLARSDSCGGEFSVAALSVVFVDGRFVAVGQDRDFGVWPEPWPCPTSDPAGYIWIGETVGP